jgi:hypothetical protein
VVASRGLGSWILKVLLKLIGSFGLGAESWEKMTAAATTKRESISNHGRSCLFDVLCTGFGAISGVCLGLIRSNLSWGTSG